MAINFKRVAHKLPSARFFLGQRNVPILNLYRCSKVQIFRRRLKVNNTRQSGAINNNLTCHGEKTRREAYAGE